MLIDISICDDSQLFLCFRFHGFASHELEGVLGHCEALLHGHWHLFQKVLRLFLASEVGQELEGTFHACFFIYWVFYILSRGLF